MPTTDLSPRQLEVMQYLVNGISFKEIAGVLGMRYSTVKKHAVRAKAKIGAKSLYHCIAILVSRGVVIPADLSEPIDN